MLLELHCHTSLHSPCSHLEPVEAVRRVHVKGLQGLVITEHHYLWSPEALADLRQQAGVDDSFVLLAGQEVETEVGHILVFGAEEHLEPTQLAALRQRWPAAVLVWAHPFRHGAVPGDHELQNPLVDAIELFNSNHTARAHYYALAAWHRLKFVATSGSDAHAPKTAGIFPTHFDHPVRNISELVEEIRHGRCRPLFKEIPKSGANLAVTEISIGTKGADEHRQRIILKHAKADAKWQQQQRAAAIVEALYARGFDGHKLRVPRVIEANEREHLLIEEGQRGKLLFDLINGVSAGTATEYVELAAAWLARMHHLALRLDEVPNTVTREQRRLRSYRAAFIDTANPHRQAAEELLDFIAAIERQMFEQDHAQFVQNHGDYHPKNIIIGQDRAHDARTLFVSVIDFANSLLFLPAFDVGYYLAQHRFQFQELPEVLSEDCADSFLATYLREVGPVGPSFRWQVRFFEVRANMSIAAFLIKVGKGTSPELERLMARSAELRAALANERA